MNHTSQQGFASIAIFIIIAILGGLAAGYVAFHPRTTLPVFAPSPTPSLSSTPKPSIVPTHSPTPVPSTVPSSTKQTIFVALNQQFTLKKGQIAQVSGTGIEIEITNFYNHPCPKGVQCFWSGVGMMIEYRKNGVVQKGMNLTEAFGYRTQIVKTDHETYATLIFGTKVDTP